MQIDYQIHDSHRGNPTRRVDVPLSEQQLTRLVEDGYHVQEGFVAGDALSELQAAADRVEAVERTDQNLGRAGGFGGFFSRYVEDKEGSIRDLAFDPRLVSLSRAVLGPAVRLSQATLRVTYPGEPAQETCWHIHRRVIPEPVPAWFSMPHTVDALVYLDATDTPTGPLAVIPRSHTRLHEQPARDDKADKPDQRVLEMPAGSLVFLHSNLWHRGLPTTPKGNKRRLLIITYQPAWFRGSIHGQRPEQALTREMLRDADEQTRELLGEGGFV